MRDGFEHILCIKKRSDNTDDTIGEKGHKYSNNVPLDDGFRFVRLLRVTSRKYIVVSSDQERYSGNEWYNEQEDICDTSEYSTKCSNPRLTAINISMTISKWIHFGDIDLETFARHTLCITDGIGICRYIG